MFRSGALHDGCAGFRIFQNLCDPALWAMQRQIVSCKLLILKRLAWRVSATSSVAAWIGTELASLRGEQAAPNFGSNWIFLLRLLSVEFVLVSDPTANPNLDFLKGRKNGWSRGRCFMMLLIRYSLNCCPRKSIHTRLLLPLEVGLPKKRAVCDLIWCGQLVSVQVSKSVTGFNAVPCFLDCHGSFFS